MRDYWQASIREYSDYATVDENFFDYKRATVEVALGLFMGTQLWDCALLPGK